MKIFRQSIYTVFAMLGLVTLVGAPAFAYDPIKDSAACKSDTPPEICKDLSTPDGKKAVNATVTNVINILLYVIGIISVIMIIVGGIKYTTSNGDSSGITSAKNTILYAIVGLVVALMAYSIVNFVIGRI